MYSDGIWLSICLFKKNNIHTTCLSWFSMASFRIKRNILDLWGPPSPSSINNYTRNTANLPLCCCVIHSIIFQDESQVLSDCCFALLLFISVFCCLWVYSQVGAWWPTYSINPQYSVSVCLTLHIYPLTPPGHTPTCRSLNLQVCTMSVAWQ